MRLATNLFSWTRSVTDGILIAMRTSRFSSLVQFVYVSYNNEIRSAMHCLVRQCVKIGDCAILHLFVAIWWINLLALIAFSLQRIFALWWISFNLFHTPISCTNWVERFCIETGLGISLVLVSQSDEASKTNPRAISFNLRALTIYWIFPKQHFVMEYLLVIMSNCDWKLDLCFQQQKQPRRQQQQQQWQDWTNAIPNASNQNNSVHNKKKKRWDYKIIVDRKMNVIFHII